MIYFIGCGEFVKIGRANDPAQRAKDLQIGNPYVVELMGTFDGNDAEEKRLHAAFAPFHHRAERFFLTKTIHQFVVQHCDKAKITASQPAKRNPDRKASATDTELRQRNAYHQRAWRRRQSAKKQQPQTASPIEA
jgi:hypothetical protein